MYKRRAFKAFSVLIFTVVLVFFANNLITTKTWAASMYWDGGASTANWADALNWSTDMIPTADDDVLIDVAATINLSSSTTINSLVLGNTGGTTTPILNFSYDAAGTSSPLTIDSGDLVIYSGGQITHSAGTTTIVGTIAINIQNGNLTIATGGKIDVTGKGYASTEGTGAGTDGSSGNGAGGGAYGGNGGTGDAGRAGGTGYGSISNPTNMGSGGGYSGLAGYNGGAGGGLITMTIGGTLDVQGSIISNGGTAGAKDGTMNDYAGGGGSGGGINITAETFTGAGSITANGSTGGNTGDADGGGGGGGRIAVNYTSKTYTGTISANGGSGPDSALNGGAGTIYLDDGTGNGDLTISNSTARTTLTEGLTPLISGTFDNVTISGYSYVPLSGTLTISEALSITEYSFVKIDSSSTTTYGSISWSGTTYISDLGGNFPLVNDNVSLTIPSGTSLYSNVARTYDNVTVSGIWSHNSNSTAQTYILDVDITNDLTIASGGKIDVTGKGYTSSEGSGAGIDGGDDNGAGGGAYGGNGGKGTTGRAGGTGYGSISNPTSLGSGGGYSGLAGCNGGAGGGLITIIIGGTLNIQGNIYANAGVACASDGTMYDRTGGGGSGGGINITAGALTGTGSITANGSAGGNTGDTDGGGGGGGRIAINYTSNTFTGTISADGGLGPDGAHNGGAGTIYLDDGTGNGELIISSATARATLVEGLTPLIIGTFDNVTISGYSCIPLSGTLTVSEALSIAENSYISLSGNLSVSETLSIAGNTFIQIDASSTTTYGSISWSGTTYISDLGGNFPLINDNVSLNIPSGATLYSNVARTYDNVTVSGTWSHNSNSTVQTYILDVDVTNDLTIASGGKIDVTGKGYASSEGPGAGTDGSKNNGAGGGAYGGNGGNGATGVAGGTAYGDISNPTSLGSGGGYSGKAGYNGGAGGGLITMTVGGTFDMQGYIYANGAAPGGYNYSIIDSYTGGGGSGGGINITTETFTGNGTITANGYSGYNGNKTDGGGGGGGRIAVNATSNTFTGMITATGGTGPDNATDGEDGSIYPNEISFNTSISDITISSAKVSTTISQLGITGLSRYGHIVSRTDLQLDPSLPPIYTQYALGEPTLNTGLIFEDQISLHGTLYSGATVEDPTSHIVSGHIGNALSFDGSNDYIDLPDGFSNFTNGFTASFWIYPTANQSYSRIFDIGQGQANDNIMAYREGGSSDLVFNILTGSTGHAITAKNAITNNEWQHFVVTVDSSAYATIYKNGTALTSGTIQLPVNETRTSNYIGRSNWSADAYYAGYIDELIFFSSSIGQTGVDYLYNEGIGQNLKNFMGDFSYNTLKGIGTYTTNLESLPSSADFSVQSYLVDNGGQTTYEEIKTFETLTPNTSPAVDASNIIIEKNGGDFYAGQSYPVETIYSDTDGSSDLNTLYLKLDNPDGDDIEMYASNSSEDLTDQTPTISSGSLYISNAKYSITPSYGTENEVKVTWTFDILWNWTESTNIEYGIKAIDISNADSTYSYTNNDYIYENDLTFTGTLTVEDSSLNQIASDSWLLPNESITLSGLTVVYEDTTTIYPLDKDFNVTITDTNSNIWVDGISSGESFAVSVTTSATSSNTETFSIDITEIPTGGSDISNQSFNFKIDADDPSISNVNSTTHPDSNKWYSTNIARIVWEAVDLESGIKNIFRYVSEKENELSNTILQNGTPTTLSEWTSGVLTNGVWHFYLLVEDLVGNISFDKIYLKIDNSTPDIVDVTGSNENVWQNSDGGPAITWTDPRSLSDDMFYITIDGSAPNNSNFAYATNQNGYDLPTLGDGIHVIKVIAQNGAGTYSEIKEFIIRYDATPPDSVKNFNSAIDSQNNVQLTWENPVDSSFVKVVIKKGMSANTTDGVIIYEGNKTTFTDSGLSQLTKYFYTAIAYDNANNTSKAATTNIRTQDILAPSEVGDFSISQVSNNVLIKWKNPTNDDFEKVVLKRDGVTIYEGNKNSFNDILIEEGSYSYIITTYDTSGNVSKEISATFNFVPKLENKPTENNQTEKIEAKRNETIEIKIPVEQLVTVEQAENIDKVILVINNTEYEMTLSEDKEYFTTTAIAPAVKGQHTITAMAVKDGEVISAYYMTLDVKSDVKTDTKSFFNTYGTYIYVTLGVLLLASISLYAIKHTKNRRTQKTT